MKGIAIILFILVCILVFIVVDQVKTIKCLTELNHYAWEKMQKLIQDEFIEDDANEEIN